jgi:hypothetical protein
MTSRGWVRLAAAVAAVAQLGLLGFAGWVASPAALVLGELALGSLVAVGLLVGRYGALRQRYRSEVEQSRALHERQAVADALHDVVGHEISLIAMQAGLLELRSDGATAELAAELRERAEHAVASLHHSIHLLGAANPEGPPNDDNLPLLLERYRAAGADVAVHGGLPETTGIVATAAVAVLREALTNAARHAPGRPVDVRLVSAQDRVEIAVTVIGAPLLTAGSAGGHGLSSLRRRVQSLGGTLVVEHDEQGHTLTACLPLDEVGGKSAIRTPVTPRPVRRLLREAAIPIVVVVGCAIAFYGWATHDAVVEPTDQARVAVGMSRAVAEPLLPSRQAPVHLIRPSRHPTSWKCEMYTNGNFPLGIATFEVCFHAATVVRVTDLAAKPLW